VESIVISGGGPVGLTVALVLAQYDIPVIVCEAEPTLSSLSRAATWHASTMELLDEMGFAWDLIDVGKLIPSVQYRDRDAGFIAEFNYFELLHDVTRFPLRLQAEQSMFAEMVLARLHARHPNVEVRFGARVVGVEDGKEGAVAIVETASGTERIPGRFVVGADGAHSAVRRSLDVGFEGSTYPSRFCMILTSLDVGKLMPETARVTYFSSGDEAVTILTLPDHWRVVFQIPADEPDEVAKSPARVQERLNGFLPPIGEPFPVLETLIYGVHQRVADSYRGASVLLAGDAGHLNNPNGGMGLNCGVHDAYMLGCSIGEYLHGLRDESVLDEYADVRRRAAKEDIIPRAERHHFDSEEKQTSARAERQQALRATSENPEAACAWVMEHALFSSQPTPRRIAAFRTGAPR
jgi:2-polyprenyl-6-methoxyphenol hydroxylase-like FAD-dependent oxidoreductase